MKCKSRFFDFSYQDRPGKLGVYRLPDNIDTVRRLQPHVRDLPHSMHSGIGPAGSDDLDIPSRKLSKNTV